MLDIFNDDAFTTHALTDAINVAPYQASRIGAMGLFEEKNPTTHTVFLERRGNVISLIPSKRRGSGETTKKPARQRDIRPLMIPYVPYDDEVLASDLSGVRDFDTEDAVETVAGVVNEKLEEMRQDHEQTHEYLRIGAVKGVIIDGDGTTTLANLFTLFGLSQTVVFFDLSNANANIKQDCIDIVREIEQNLGGGTYSYIHALVGDTFWDKLTQHPQVATAYNEQTNYKYQIETQGQGTIGPGRRTSIFQYGDITFENYRGKVGSTAFIAADKAHFFPVGVRGLFREYYGPANTITDVNKPGKPVYAQQRPKDWDEGIDLHTESNPLMICTRPKLLILGDSDAS